MRTNVICSALIAIVMLPAAVALAENDASYYVPQRPVQSPRWAMHHASTYREGVLRGWADLSRAVGESNYNHSLAAVNYQEATRRALDNHKQFVNDYFQKKHFNRAARFGRQNDRPSQEELARHAKDKLPARLASYEYLRSLGELSWPAVLNDAAFVAEREAINKAMAQRTVQNSGIGSANYIDIKHLAAQIEAKLRSRVEGLSSGESIAARKFLKSLVYEARFPLSLDVAGLAAK